MDKKTVTERIEQTAKETEKLKNELAALIASGITSKVPVISSVSQSAHVESRNKVQIIKSYDVTHSLHTNKPLVAKSTLDNAVVSGSSPKKPKCYNVEEAREYIKKQKNIRAEEIKNKKTGTGIDAQLKKEKLKQLQNRAREIVKKNVETKRSKSATKDKARNHNYSSQQMIRASSEMALDNVVQEDQGKSEVLERDQLHVPSRPATLNAEVNKNVMTWSTTDTERWKAKESETRQQGILTFPNTSEPLGTSRTFRNQYLQIPNEYDFLPNHHRTSSSCSNLIKMNNKPNINPSKLKILSNITLRPADTNLCEMAAADQVKPVQSNMDPSKVFPEWLCERPKADPHNFINTVKRHLKFDDKDYDYHRMPDKVDVAIQSSVKEDKCPNNGRNHSLKLCSSNKCKDAPVSAKTSGSDSDTSKNIPSISNESMISLKQSELKLVGDSSLNLDPAGIEEVKLKSHSRHDEHSLSAVKKRLFLDIPDEIPVDINKSRESILSFNQALGSPNYVHLSIEKAIDRKDESDDYTSSFTMSDEPSDSISAINNARLLSASTIKNTLIEKNPDNNHMSEAISTADITGVKDVSESKPSVKQQSSVSHEYTSLTSTLRPSDDFRPTETIVSSLESATFQPNKSSLDDPFRNVTKRSKPTLSKSEGHLNILDCNYGKSELFKNITIRRGESEQNLKSNDIHLKFEAEIHLLTDFNNSIRRFTEIEKAFENLRSNDPATTENVNGKLLENKDTQTSILSSPSHIAEGNRKALSSKSTSTVATDTKATSSLQITQLFDSVDENSLLDLSLGNTSTTSNDVSTLNSSNCVSVKCENAVLKNVLGMSLKMFEQMIKDEDARIENWKKVVKIREQALLDRTRGELIWLEMQKKQLIETKKLSEASLIRKKQRGILLKHQQEKREMQRLKEMQKEESNNRKKLLKKERHEIKKQLLTENTPAKLKITTERRRRHSGPIRVIQTSETTIHSETSLSRGIDQEIRNITKLSRSQSMVSILAETSDNFNTDIGTFNNGMLNDRRRNMNSADVAEMRKTLLMRERELAKRRKAVEGLLQWHKKLLEEERAVEELEGKIGTIISKIPKQSDNEKAVTRTKLPIYEEDSAVSTSPMVLERLQSPRVPSVSSVSSKGVSEEGGREEDVASGGSNMIQSSNANYSADFDAESVQKSSDDSVSSISQLIEGFTKIEDNILNSSVLSKKQSSAEEVVVREAEANVSEKSDDGASIVIVEEPTDAKQQAPSETNEVASEESVRDVSEVASFSTEEIQELAIDAVGTSETLDTLQAVSPGEQLETMPEEHTETIEEHIESDVNLQSPVSPEDESHPPTVSAEPSATIAEPEEMQSFENKTDEEKAASLSGKNRTSSEDSSALVAEDENQPSTSAVTSEISGNDSQPVSEEISVEAKSSVEQSPKTEEEKNDDSSEESYTVVSPRHSDSSVISPVQKSPVPSQIKSSSDGKKQETSVMSPNKSSSELGFIPEEKKQVLLGTEAEELHRKQLAIEQEIKLLKEQQQKEATTPVFLIREIPNKPPPPYTPPSKAKIQKAASVIPETKDEIEQITEYSAKIIHKAYLSNNLENIAISDNTLNLIAKNIDKGRFKYVFDVCKEIAQEHYSQFKNESLPSWLRVEQRSLLGPKKPLDAVGLNLLMNKKLYELFGFEKEPSKRENMIVKWSRKKRDHVDEVLVQEMLLEEPTWVTYEREEALVKDRLTDRIMEMLVKDTAQFLKHAIAQKYAGEN